MKLRVARHTKNLQPLIDFYTGIIGLTVLGDFKDHDGYNGVFIGHAGWHWHLEFTTSADEPQHYTDEDDLLVFYADSNQEFDNILNRAKNKRIKHIAPQNPYWHKNGILMLDPDGFKVVIAKQIP